MTIAERCSALAEPVAEELGLMVWDVRYEKEGSRWMLRYFIDKEGGIEISDCEQFSRAVEVVLDKEDPIASSYVLEVSSPGIERELKKPWHFEHYMGEKVTVKLIRPLEGKRLFVGTLEQYDSGDVVVKDESGSTTLESKNISSVKLFFDGIGGMISE